MTITITATDFDFLTDTVMGWKGNNWESQDGRFTGNLSYEWAIICWYDSRLNFIMARSFLKANNYEYVESYDQHMDAYVLLTNYDSFNMAVSV